MKDKKSEEIQDNLRKIQSDISQANFIYDLLSVYNPRSSVERLKKGTYNLSKNTGEIIWKKKLFFQEVKSNKLHSSVEKLRKDSATSKHAPRFIIATDYKTLVSIDTKTSESLDIPIVELDQNYEFFYPWAGREKVKEKPENYADVKAAQKMVKLYDAIKKDNPDLNDKELHALNVFFSRLLFCFFSESTEIFERSLFTKTIACHTNENGSDLSQFLLGLFESLDKKNKASYPKFLQKFPYVNGTLFAEKFSIPQFSRNSRKILLECGDLNWSSINPDIFGSMIQAVVSESQRSSMGMHYTSVTNIMKVINPLFLDDLNDEFKKSFNNTKKLQKLLHRLSNIRIFDPACGSGNFLIIAYKELRELEIKIFKQLQIISKQKYLPLSGIFLTQFYGIELDDFAHEIAILSLWLAEHQMNVRFKETFGEARPSLPLRQGANVICGNAVQLNWEIVCPKKNDLETYILGNPPYLGAAQQTKHQKEDMKNVFSSSGSRYKDLDYISCWFLKSAYYIKNINSSYVSFVSTNSVSQGKQANLLWNYVLTTGIEIYFAHQSFKWSNFAKGNAGVSCVIIGLRNKSKKTKYIFKENCKIKVQYINQFLREEKNIDIKTQKKPISKLPIMTMGSMAYDDGNLLMGEDEFRAIVKELPEIKKLTKKAVGAKEFIHGISRYCIWIPNQLLDSAKKIPRILTKLKNIEKYRLKSKRKATHKLANTPHRFGETRHREGPSIIIPRVTSERREYIPFGFLDEKSVILDSAQVIYNPEPYIFGVISSKMHMTWVKAVAGRLKTDIRYSSTLCYNTFPFPDISSEQKNIITTHVYNVISEREKYPEKTKAELYDPEKMPKGLKKAHENLDKAIESCYRSKPFSSDEERLEYLFKLYDEMINKEKEEKKHAKSC